MRKEAARALREQAQAVGDVFSSGQRGRNSNYGGETFVIDRIVPLSEDAAAVVYLKPESGKRAAFFFFQLHYADGARWRYFIPTDSHILAMEAFGAVKRDVEAGNFDLNFDAEAAVDYAPTKTDGQTTDAPDEEWIRKLREATTPEDSPGEAADYQRDDDIPF